MIEKLIRFGPVVAFPSLPLILYNNLVKCHLKEVVDDCAIIDNINVYDIIGVAFVFHANFLEKECVNCAGMPRGFYTCYKLICGGLSPLAKWSRA
jgi:hypothetical protein